MVEDLYGVDYARSMDFDDIVLYIGANQLPDNKVFQIMNDFMRKAEEIVLRGKQGFERYIEMAPKMLKEIERAKNVQARTQDIVK